MEKFVARVPQNIRGPRLPIHMVSALVVFWGTRASNFSIYTTKMEGAGPKILGTGAKFKQVPCQKNCRVNRALGTGAKFKRVPCQKSCRVNRAKSPVYTTTFSFATFLLYRHKMPKQESMVRIVSHFSEGIRFLRGFFSLDTTVHAAMAIIY